MIWRTIHVRHSMVHGMHRLHPPPSRIVHDLPGGRRPTGIIHTLCNCIFTSSMDGGMTRHMQAGIFNLLSSLLAWPCKDAYQFKRFFSREHSSTPHIKGPRR